MKYLPGFYEYFDQKIIEAVTKQFKDIPGFNSNKITGLEEFFKPKRTGLLGILERWKRGTNRTK